MGFIRKRLKKATPEQMADFRERMSNANVPWLDKIIMVLTGWVIIVLPCLLILVGMSALIMFLLGML